MQIVPNDAPRDQAGATRPDGADSSRVLGCETAHASLSLKHLTVQLQNGHDVDAAITELRGRTSGSTAVERSVVRLMVPVITSLDAAVLQGRIPLREADKVYDFNSELQRNAALARV